MNNVTLRATIGLLGGLVLAACRVGPKHEVPEVRAEPAWVESAAAAPGAPDTRWWTAFADPVLDSLVDRALANNHDLKIATARLREARAQRAATAGQWDPQVEAGAGFSRGRASETTSGSRGGTSNLYDAGFDASWEIDLFGLRDRAIDAADANVGVATEARRDALVTLLGEVARNYVVLRGLQKQLTLTHDNLKAQQDTATLTHKGFDAGLRSGLDVARADALVATTAAAIPAFEGQMRTVMYTLSVLLGEAPGPLALELERTAPLPEPPAVVAAGLPSELLRRRPDIRRAERELARATAESGEAVAARYPRLVLGASLRQQSEKGGDLFDSASNVWSLGGSLTAPIFNGGTLKANAEAADARAEAARLTYERTVLSALAEVESALAVVSRERVRRETLDGAVQADRRAVTLATDLYSRGLSSFFEVLEAQQALFRVESSYADSATELAARTVALYKALGGGWQIEGDESGS